MQWAPDSPDLWAPDSERPDQWASDSFEPLTLRRAVDLLLDAKAAEGASPKTITWHLGRRGALDWRGMQQVIKRLKTRAGISGRLSPHSLRHTVARSYLVKGGDVFSLPQILGHTTLDMVKCYVSLAAADVAAKHRTASPADRLLESRGR